MNRPKQLGICQVFLAALFCLPLLVAAADLTPPVNPWQCDMA